MVKWGKHLSKHAAQMTSCRSFWGVLNVPLASELTIKRKFSCDPALIGQNVHVHSGHIRVSLHFVSFYQGNLISNNGVDK